MDITFYLQSGSVLKLEDVQMDTSWRDANVIRLVREDRTVAVVHVDRLEAIRFDSPADDLPEDWWTRLRRNGSS